MQQPQIDQAPILYSDLRNTPVIEGAGWPEPQELASVGCPELYPRAALPDAIRSAVDEVQGFTQAPVALVAASALAALSLSAQALADVRRAEGLSGPSGLYFMTVADSGERKTASDHFFTGPVRQWEVEQIEAAKPILSDFRATQGAWTARRDGLLAAIRQAQSKGKSTADLERALQDLEPLQPVAPRLPRILRADSTSEALAYNLVFEWPSAGVMSSEAGTVLGGHAMSRESRMRNLALLNCVWDGGSLPISRRASESFTVRGARLTMGLQAQPAAITAFVNEAGGLARGMGFIARFMCAWPTSTQGTRIYRDPPAAWPALSAYTDGLIALLDTRPNIDTDGVLHPPVLDLSREGKTLWRKFHDDVERELAEAGELAEVRDVASKAADNVARLACLFHVYGQGAAGEIGPATVEAAGCIVSWHLLEARRFFRGLATPPDVARAVKLDRWLLSRCADQGTDRIATREVQQFGPVRNRKALDAAIAELMEAGRIRLDESGRAKDLMVNPSLLGGSQNGPA
jgi:putative DNA primase/helicase